MAICTVSVSLGAQRRFGLHHLPSVRRTHRRVHAKRVHVIRSSQRNEDGNEDKSSKEAKFIDWDGAWKQIGRELRGTGTTNPSDYVDRPANFRSEASGKAAKDQIKQDEKVVLNTWTSTQFTQFGLASVAALLFFFIVVIGPPPDDGRCTLPWC